MSAIKQYEFLLESGDLLELYPGLSGIWKDDKDKFTKLYNLNIEAIKELEINFEEEYEDE